MTAFIPADEFHAAPASEAVGNVVVVPLSEPEFSEGALARARRIILGIAYSLRLSRIRLLPQVAWLTAEFFVFPAVAEARLKEPSYRGERGLVAVSENLTPSALLDLYRNGFFPFCHIRPMKWWSPEVRAVLHPNETHIEKNLRRLIRQGKYTVTFDQDFAGVMRACAAPREGRVPLTWITPQIMNAFWRLHRAGHAHSVEVWDREGKLVGGLYGIAAGDVFFGESQFSLVRDASKIAVATLHCHLADWGFVLRDAKWQTDHLGGLGFHGMSRTDFLAALREHAWKPGRVGRWKVNASLDVAAWQSKG